MPESAAASTGKPPPPAEAASATSAAASAATEAAASSSAATSAAEAASAAASAAATSAAAIPAAESSSAAAISAAESSSSAAASSTGNDHHQHHQHQDNHYVHRHHHHHHDDHDSTGASDGAGGASEVLVLQEKLRPVRENPFVTRERDRRSRRRPRLGPGAARASSPAQDPLLELYSHIPGIRTIRADNIIIIESDPDYYLQRTKPAVPAAGRPPLPAPAALRRASSRLATAPPRRGSPFTPRSKNSFTVHPEKIAGLHPPAASAGNASPRSPDRLKPSLPGGRPGPRGAGSATRPKSPTVRSYELPRPPPPASPAKASPPATTQGSKSWTSTSLGLHSTSSSSVRGPDPPLLPSPTARGPRVLSGPNFEIRPAVRPDRPTWPSGDRQAQALNILRRESGYSITVIPKPRQPAGGRRSPRPPNGPPTRGQGADARLEPRAERPPVVSSPTFRRPAAAIPPLPHRAPLSPPSGRSASASAAPSPVPPASPPPARSPLGPSPAYAAEDAAGRAAAQVEHRRRDPRTGTARASASSGIGNRASGGATITKEPGNSYRITPAPRKPAVPDAGRAEVDAGTPTPRVLENTHTPLGQLVKKRFPPADEIEVIGGYQRLSKSCLLSGARNKK
ncbi:LOW QUALITY PROTEIN: taperin-like, partial [Lethenteron reissneri]|uniref:LOW QUALITY PROTEIN: taperin-like n=1 Tax=Lethenteron reissneri TaxID=7753 RepID=UPI002AB688DF